MDNSYLPNWLRNVEREFDCLAQFKGKSPPTILEQPTKVRALLQRLHQEQDSNAAKVGRVLTR